jgi:hypothetical protein
MDLGEGPRYLSFDGSHQPILAVEVILNNADSTPGTFGWLTRFSVITTGAAAETWPTINALYIEGILDPDGNWRADFPQPTFDDPTKF